MKHKEFEKGMVSTAGLRSQMDRMGQRSLIVRLLGACILVVALLGLYGCSTGPAENEILLQIQLDTAEDIGLLIVDWSGGGSDGSGGVSNANKTLLRRGEKFGFSLMRDNFEHPDDLHSLELLFRVITEYQDPNMPNEYPEELTKPTNPISFDVAFGNAYKIRISGDAASGYTATYEPAA